ncbi:hypothetical protein [Parablautia muri]|uniref:Uncharacterized protein n=1 Tax=Parablautia muri TaxID=2320879 RepID=A0A9X5GT23_9FIRM|nr:hypothetical protein [Parablautia muri]NBJ94598.1 hypothetical protein [Parablautia muri]
MKGKNRYAKNYSLPFLQEIDAKILQFMVEHTNRNMAAVMNILTFFGTIGGVILILILMILITVFRKKCCYTVFWYYLPI